MMMANRSRIKAGLVRMFANRRRAPDRAAMNKTLRDMKERHGIRPFEAAEIYREALADVGLRKPTLQEEAVAGLVAGKGYDEILAERAVKGRPTTMRSLVVAASNYRTGNPELPGRNYAARVAGSLILQIRGISNKEVMLALNARGLDITEETISRARKRVGTPGKPIKGDNRRALAMPSVLFTPEQKQWLRKNHHMVEDALHETRKSFGGHVEFADNFMLYVYSRLPHLMGESEYKKPGFESLLRKEINTRLVREYYTAWLSKNSMLAPEKAEALVKIISGVQNSGMTIQQSAAVASIPIKEAELLYQGYLNRVRMTKTLPEYPWHIL